MNKKKLKTQAGVTLLESVIAIALLTVLSLMAFNSLLSGTLVYGDRVQAYKDLEDVYGQIEGATLSRPTKTEGTISFTYGTLPKEVEVKGDYRYGIDEEGKQVVLVAFSPKATEESQ